MNRATATAAPTTVELGGKNYRLTPLRDRDWGEFEKWLQDRHYAAARRNLQGLNAEAQRDLMRHAHDRATAIVFTDNESAKMMGTYEGACFITYLSLRHEHPEITEDEVADLLFDPEALSRAMDRLPLGMPDEPAGKKKRSGTKAASRKKKKAARASKTKGPRKT